MRCVLLELPFFVSEEIRLDEDKARYCVTYRYCLASKTRRVLLELPFFVSEDMRLGEKVYNYQLSFRKIGIICSTRFPSGTSGEWRKNELKNVQHAILYHTRMILYHDVMKYLCCSTYGSMHVSHRSRDPQPAGLQIAGSHNKSNY